MSLRSYSSPFSVGHAGAAALFDGPVVVEEKIDGSQFSFGLVNGELHCRSKGAVVHVDAPEGMFARGVETAKAIAPYLRDGWTYRGEYLQKPKHNSLAYERVPVGHVMLFDVDTGDQAYLTADEKRAEAERIGLECVPVLFVGVIETADQLKALLPAVSVLGAVAAEGVVVKNYAHYAPDKKTLMGKYVTGAFKEVHGQEWKKSNPGRSDILEQIIAAHATPARWQKAVQHLRDAGKLEGSPKDIGALLKEVGVDVRRECEADIRDALFAWAWPQIQRGVVRGVPEWYKGELLAAAFDTGASA